MSKLHDTDDIGVNPTAERPFSQIIDTLISRRGALKGMAAGAGAAIAGGAVSHLVLAGPAQASTASELPTTLGFEEAAHVIADSHHVAPGYDARVLIRWGDKVVADAPEFDANNLTVEAQEKQFGYNNDYVGFFPLPVGSDNSEEGILVVNHEYTNPELMFDGLTADNYLELITREQCDIEMAAHGASVIEVRKENGAWRVVPNSPFARRISMRSTECVLSGPAAGHDRLKTSADPSGRKVIGTLNNCAGGKTPWGTVLSGEENFHQYFAGDPSNSPEAAAYKRLGVSGKPTYAWGKYFDRMNVEKEPNEPNRFGWIVEWDPYDPTSVPVKRTALGRFKHEGGTSVVNPDGTVTIYSGDDERFEYLYRFVTTGKYNPNDRRANFNLLDEGTLSVAKFNDDGTMEWLPLVHGQGPLTAANGFASQADICIDTRRAADLVGATPMDRPEDVEPNPVTGKVYMMLTNNTNRKADQIDAANPRADNAFGHVIEMLPPGPDGKRDHTAKTYGWNVFLLAGNPAKPEHGARYHAQTSAAGWLAAPDNCAFDRRGRLWISSDQGSAQRKNGIPDGMYAMDTEGPGRALSRFFYACPRDAEMCGPEFTPDGKTLFLAVQHPGEEKNSTFANPSTRFPDFTPGMPPRPSLVVVTKKDGGEIGA
ncbi:PhoX family phosphatase [Telmatospirillum sp. J64-1]|uniref:PhoX family protein n=1 Tax=Telmatospirillum sp. J64-1 TaxID=2502183 RepID=UPI00115E67F4|nr:PhoX family phosphatase [Telmatospirillum sp. J64-1]